MHSEGGETLMAVISRETAKQVEKPPPGTQEQVLRFVNALTASAPVGEKGANLRQFASSIDSVPAGQMILAIEEECERIDTGEWYIPARYQHHRDRGPVAGAKGISQQKSAPATQPSSARSGVIRPVS
jgi:hypothetical protein